MDTRSYAAPHRTRLAIGGESCPLDSRALALWPRLDRRSLRRCGCDPTRMVALISRRTGLPQETILGMLLGTSVSRAEADRWFG